MIAFFVGRFRSRIFDGMALLFGHRGSSFRSRLALLCASIPGMIHGKNVEIPDAGQRKICHNGFESNLGATAVIVIE